MRIDLKAAVADYNDAHAGVSLTLAELAVRVYRRRKVRKATKVQRISHIQNEHSNYAITLAEAVDLARELDIDLNTLNIKYISDGNRKSTSRVLEAEKADGQV